MGTGSKIGSSFCQDMNPNYFSSTPVVCRALMSCRGISFRYCGLTNELIKMVNVLIKQLITFILAQSTGCERPQPQTAANRPLNVLKGKPLSSWSLSMLFISFALAHGAGNTSRALKSQAANGSRPLNVTTSKYIRPPFFFL